MVVGGEGKVSPSRGEGACVPWRAALLVALLRVFQYLGTADGGAVWVCGLRTRPGGCAWTGVVLPLPWCICLTVSWAEALVQWGGGEAGEAGRLATLRGASRSRTVREEVTHPHDEAALVQQVRALQLDGLGAKSAVLAGGHGGRELR